MSRYTKGLILFTSTLLLTAGPAAAQGPEEETSPSSTQTSPPEKIGGTSRSPLERDGECCEKPGRRGTTAKPPLERNRERWKKLRPAKRKEMRRLFERLEDLPPEQRRRLIRRLRSLDASDRRRAIRDVRDRPARQRPGGHPGKHFKKLLEKLSPEKQEHFKSLPPAEKKRFVRETLAAHWKKVMSRLPPEVRERVENMSPGERREFLESRRRKRLLKKTFKDPEEVNRLRSLPRRRLREALMDPAGENPQQKPEFLSEDTWQRWLTLKPRERSQVLRQLLRPGGHDRHRGRKGHRDRKGRRDQKRPGDPERPGPQGLDG